MSQVRTVKCPQCGAPVPWVPESRYRPFCSERCKQIDLGAWASESYRMPASAPGDPGEGDDAPGPRQND
ncbi:DNA gyrase inhibitor YacG [Azoarcus sp. KH32C]|uniref:DNA gyrase inhibitor YacG n=1 Tax=Azoarcus sp. KH32C TaxID=748247 RepID=UPI0002386233|nr:DNA gyrase inhibitor YacG [Azoarcus sp. KH32C]BAL23007.1 hypothetical protein AZKH_0666 [Azoarcus sp. KH32C]